MFHGRGLSDILGAYPQPMPGGAGTVQRAGHHHRSLSEYSYETITGEVTSTRAGKTWGRDKYFLKYVPAINQDECFNRAHVQRH